MKQHQIRGSDSKKAEKPGPEAQGPYTAGYSKVEGLEECAEALLKSADIWLPNASKPCPRPDSQQVKDEGTSYGLEE